jgi:hypothetical protein
MIRNRAKPFPNPLVPIEEEFDPERALWVPGRKTIFLPAPKPEPISWDVETKGLDLFFDRDRLFGGAVAPGVRGLDWGVLRAFIADCSPCRGEYLGIPRTPENVPRNYGVGTYGDIQRSTEPAFRVPSNFRPHPAQRRFYESSPTGRLRRYDVGRESR